MATADTRVRVGGGGTVPLAGKHLLSKAREWHIQIIHPTLYVVHGSAKPVLHGTNSTEPNLFHHGETTYRVG